MFEDIIYIPWSSSISVIDRETEIRGVVVGIEPPGVGDVVAASAGVEGTGWRGDGVEGFASCAGFGAVFVDVEVEGVGYVDCSCRGFWVSD